jgi:pyocin large subunit-like protein
VSQRGREALRLIGRDPVAIAVFAVLREHASNADGLAWPAVETNIDYTGLGRRTVQRKLRALDAVGVTARARGVITIGACRPRTRSRMCFISSPWR